VGPEVAGELDIIGISCSVFRPEIEFLVRRGEIGFPVTYVDSKLHMRPEMLLEALRSRLDDALRPGVGVILFFGDCHAQMHKFSADPRIVRLDGLNCGDMLLSRPRYKELMRQRAFLMFPEWAVRWRVVFQDLADTCAQSGLEFFRDAHDKLAYVDTGVRPVPEAELSACSAAVGMPWEILPVTLDHFHGLIQNAVVGLHGLYDEIREAEEP